MRPLLISVFLLIACTCFSQLSAVKNKVSNGYNFWINLPEGYSQVKSGVPVLIFLHGRSLSGSNLESVKRYGVITEIVKGRKIPAIVIAPQSPKGESWSPDKILNVLNYVQRNFKTDTNRVFVAGMSMGGYGTIRFAGKYPNKIASAIAMCGGGNISDAPSLNTLPLWILHGKKDVATPYTESLKIANAVKKQGGNLLRYTEYETLGHGEMARCFSFDQLYEWLFLFSKDKRPIKLTDNISMPEELFYRGRRKPSVKPEKKTETEASKKSEIIPEAEKKSPSKKSKKSSTKIHVVKKGDTLFSIAKRNGTTVNELRRLNKLKEGEVLMVGKRLRIK